LTLVTTHDCYFYPRAHDLLDDLGITVREIRLDPHETATLVERGIPLSFLPVLLDGDRVLAYGRFSEQRLRDELGL
jgi:hypothetical protein